MRTIRQRLIESRRLCQEARWPAVWVPQMGFIDPTRSPQYSGPQKDPDEGIPKQPSPHPKGQPTERRVRFRIPQLNYNIPDYIAPARDGSDIWALR